MSLKLTVRTASGQTHARTWDRRHVVLPALDDTKHQVHFGLGGLYKPSEVKLLLTTEGHTCYGPDPSGFQDSGGYSFLFPAPGLVVKSLTYGEPSWLNKDGDVVSEDFGSKLKKDKVLAGLHREHLLELLDDPKVIGAYVAGKQCIVHYSQGGGGFLSHLKARGVVFKDLGEDTRTMMKRVRRLLAPHLVVKHYPAGALRVSVMSGKDLDDLPEKLLDGAFFIKKSVADRVIDSFVATEGADFRNQCHKLRLQKAKIFGATILCEAGLIKGHAFVVPDEDWIHGDCDVFTHPDNVKGEVSWPTGAVVGLSPKDKGGKQARTNIQLLLNLPFLRRELKGLISQYFMDVRHKLVSGEELEDIEEIAESKARRAEKGLNTKDVFGDRRQTVWEFLQTGHDYSHSTSLLRAAFEAHTGRLTNDSETDRVSLPIPHGIRCQVVPEAVTAACGLEVKVESGQISWCDEYGVCVVTDQDWLDNLTNHGGCDEDDEFTVILRRSEETGEGHAVVARIPNYIGEYAVYTPTFTLPPVRRYYAEGKYAEVKFFQASLEDLPPSLKTLLETGGLKKGELPKGEAYVGQVGIGWVKDAWEKGMDGMSPGEVINALMALTMGLGRASKVLPDLMEAMVDMTTKNASPEAVLALKEFSQKVKEAIARKGMVIDPLVARRFLKEETKGWNVKPLWVSEAQGLIEKEVAESRAYVEAHVPHREPEETRAWMLDRAEEEDVNEVFKWFGRQMYRLSQIKPKDRSKAEEQRVRLEKDAHMEFVKKELKRVLTEREQVRYFAHLLHTVPTRDGKVRGDAVLVDEKGVWQLYKEVLKGM